MDEASLRARHRPAACAIGLAVLAGLLLVGVPARAQKPADGKAATCMLDGGEDRTVTRVVDGETLVLDGGSEVRLVGALAPRAFDTAGAASDGSLNGWPLNGWPLADRARESLERIVAGRNVRIAFAGRRSDRYGRLLAHVFSGPEGERIWVQGEQLKRGLARAYALEGSTRCLAELVAHEAVARERATGMWAEAAYVVRSADEVGALLRLAGTFQIVEGEVLGVSDQRGTTYMNFGEDWRQDFTVVMRSQARRGATDSGLVLAELKGRKVRVRGWIERRGGPMVEVYDAAAIELLSQEETEPATPGVGTDAAPSRRRSRRRADP